MPLKYVKKTVGTSCIHCLPTGGAFEVWTTMIQVCMYMYLNNSFGRKGRDKLEDRERDIYIYTSNMLESAAPATRDMRFISPCSSLIQFSNMVSSSSWPTGEIVTEKAGLFPPIDGGSDGDGGISLQVGGGEGGGTPVGSPLSRVSGERTGGGGGYPSGHGQSETVTENRGDKS